MSDVFFLGLRDSDIARDLDRYENREGFENYGYDAFPSSCCGTMAEKCSCRIANCVACGQPVSKTSGYECDPGFEYKDLQHKVVYRYYHKQCWAEKKSQEAA